MRAQPFVSPSAVICRDLYTNAQIAKRSTEHIGQANVPAPRVECLALFCREVMSLVDANDTGPAAAHMPKYAFRYFEAHP